LELNLLKSETVSADGAAHPDFPFSIHRTFADFSFLGAPCGTDAESRELFVEKALLPALRRTRRLAKLGAVCPHTAFALIRFCGGFPCGVFYARAAGQCRAFAALDLATRTAVESFTFPIPDALWEEICAPPRHGGLGVLRLTSAAPLALAACVASSARLAARLCPAAGPADNCPLFREALSSPIFAQFPLLGPLVAHALAEENPPKHLQRTLCDPPSAAAFAERTASGTSPAVARCRSNSAPGVAAVFAPTPGEDDEMWYNLRVLWFTPPVFLAALRLHLGLPSFAASGRCPFCARTREDLNSHVPDCMRGGGRQRAHSSIKQATFAAASAAQWAPRLETTPFVGSTGRADLDCLWLDERILGDTAIVSHGPHLQAACLEAGGAATQYEATKIATYGAAAAETDSAMVITPLVWDVFGAAGNSASRFISRTGLGAAHRFGLPPSRVIGLLRERLAARVVHGIAAIVSEAIWRADAEVDLEGAPAKKKRLPPRKARRAPTPSAAAAAAEQTATTQASQTKTLSERSAQEQHQATPRTTAATAEQTETSSSRSAQQHQATPRATAAAPRKPHRAASSKEPLQHTIYDLMLDEGVGSASE
jgi:hypothetical protein